VLYAFLVLSFADYSRHHYLDGIASHLFCLHHNTLRVFGSPVQ